MELLHTATHNQNWGDMFIFRFRQGRMLSVCVGVGGHGVAGRARDSLYGVVGAVWCKRQCSLLSGVVFPRRHLN
jgi:hypothetical protein